MELSDYEILGITPKATFRQVKNAYYDLARIYHPDSKYSDKFISNDEKKRAILKLNTAYENIKKKMNVVETDLPKQDCIYQPLQVQKILDVEKLSLEDSNEEIKDKFSKKFNLNFEKNHKIQSLNDPYSIFYLELENIEDRTEFSSELILPNNRPSNPLEFGVNYVYDHSSDNYTDIRHLEYNNPSYNINDESNIDELYDKILQERNKKIELSESEKEFINKQNEITQKILESKNKIFLNQNNLLLN